uniref:uncharacterized protein LOC128931494 n=1 Tax=Callithrix jacchus TaxID=9483 RepID=UPI0023DD3693|nr:uncharacterized protein LOC128931494 [Callithrix jacchus]
MAPPDSWAELEWRTSRRRRRWCVTFRLTQAQCRPASVGTPPLLLRPPGCRWLRQGSGPGRRARAAGLEGVCIGGAPQAASGSVLLPPPPLPPPKALDVLQREARAILGCLGARPGEGMGRARHG